MTHLYTKFIHRITPNRAPKASMSNKQQLVKAIQHAFGGSKTKAGRLRCESWSNVASRVATQAENSPHSAAMSHMLSSYAGLISNWKEREVRAAGAGAGVLSCATAGNDRIRGGAREARRTRLREQRTCSYRAHRTNGGVVGEPSCPTTRRWKVSVT